MNAESTEGVWAPFVLDAVVFNRQKSICLVAAMDGFFAERMIY